MPTADEILEELRAHRRDLKTLFASSQHASSAEAAKKHEEDAARHDASAASHRLAAAKAREEEDAEDASAHMAAASAARQSAAKCRAEAKAAYEASAKTLAASDETAATQHASEAKRVQEEEDAAASVHAAAEAESKKHAEEDAAAKKASNGMWPMFAMFLRSMTDDGDNMDAMKDAGNLSLLKHMVDAMVYPAGAPAYGKKGKSQSAAHDDTAEDTALFKRLMKQYKEGDDLSASRSVTDLRMERKLRSMEAAMGEMSKLLTDTVHALRDLATDNASGQRDLVTDKGNGVNGGPVRRTMSATGGNWRGKFDDVEGDAKNQRTVAEIDAALDDEQLDPIQRMAAKIDLGWQGRIKH